MMAASFPLFGVQFFRLSDEQALRLSVPPPMLFLLLILGAGILCILAGGRAPGGFSFLRETLPGLFCIMVLFLVWHLISLMRSKDLGWGLREVAKLCMGLASFLIVFGFFPRDRQFIARFWRIALWASAVLIGYLIYHYAMVFHSPFLGNQLDAPTHTGRNMLTWYLVFTIPFSVTLVIDSRHKLFDLVPAVVLIIAWIYAGSRGAWVSVAGGLLTLLVFLVRADPRKGVWISLALCAASAVVLGVAWYVLNNFLDLDELEYSRRLLALFDPDAVPELQSSTIRLALMEKALSDFTQLPLIGIGLMNFAVTSERVSHNDYLAILADMGLIGFLLFAGLLALILLLSFRSLGGRDWLSLGTRASLIAVIISFFFINAYTNSIFWIFLAMVVVWMQVESSSPVRPAAWPLEPVGSRVN